MATYPTNIKVLDKDITNAVMTEGITTTQSLYELYIPAGTMDVNSKLRIKATLSRVSGTPLTTSNVTCIPCSEGGRIVTQQLSEAGILTPKAGVYTYGGSFSYVGEYNDQPEIYEAIYDSTSYASTFDQDRSLKLYRIRGTTFKRVTKVLTTTFNDFGIDDARLVHGITDEPTYAFSCVVSISSNAPDGFYIYWINSKTQTSYPGMGQFYLPFYTIEDTAVYLAESNTGYIRKFNQAGGIQASNTTMAASHGAPIAMHAVGGTLWVLTSSNKVVKLNGSNLTQQAVYITGLTNCRALFVSSDTNIYVSYGNPSILGISALNTGSGILTEIDSAISLSQAIGFGTYSILYFKAINNKNGYFYTTASQPFGTSGYNGIMKIGPVDCP